MKSNYYSYDKQSILGDTKYLIRRRKEKTISQKD
jgi:hypothetical protein